MMIYLRFFQCTNEGIGSWDCKENQQASSLAIDSCARTYWCVKVPICEVGLTCVLGDMQLTKTEIAQTQIIVTTPEKWDVVTRKPTGEGEIASVCNNNICTRLWSLTIWKIIKLLIIDEVHLLNDERGAVIETIVARTLRQVFLCFIMNLFSF
jgi:hypothetical protein